MDNWLGEHNVYSTADSSGRVQDGKSKRHTMEKHLEMRSFMVQPIVNLTRDHVNRAINGMSKGDRKYRTNRVTSLYWQKAKSDEDRRRGRDARRGYNDNN